MSDRKITYVIENETSLKNYVFDFLFFIIGIDGEKCTYGQADHIDIYYGNHCPEGENIALRITEADRNQSPINADILAGTVTPENIGKTLTYDIINAISELITDQVNSKVPHTGYDVHDRLSFSHSFQSFNHLGDIPLINVYVNFLLDVIQQRCHLVKVPLWPQDKTCAIGLSHDVDSPDKYAVLKGPLMLKTKPFVWHIVNILKKIKSGSEYIFDGAKDNHWLFDAIMEVEQRYGFTSTFFFASMNSYGDYGSSLDVDYDIQDIKFLELFEKINLTEHDIGLHASYSAFQDVDRFIHEKQRLERLSKRKIVGLRHHFWHMGRNYHRTLMMHESAGFTYDSSIAFNDKMGYRNNIAFPYFPWSQEADRKVNVMQLPVFCMDGNLFYRPIELEAAVDQLQSFVSIIKKSGGLGVIDWHVRTSMPRNREYKKWGDCYVRFLECLADDDTIWVTSLGNLYDRLKTRNCMRPQNDAGSGIPG